MKYSSKSLTFLKTGAYLIIQKYKTHINKIFKNNEIKF